MRDDGNGPLNLIPEGHGTFAKAVLMEWSSCRKGKVRALWELRREGEGRTQRRQDRNGEKSPKARLGCVCVCVCVCVYVCVCVHVRTYSGRILSISLR